jgi:hypothetical protein
MNLDKLEELKEKLMVAEQISDVWNFFFDHFGEDPQFIALGKTRKSPLLRSILAKLGKELFGPGGKLTALRLKVLRAQRFAHGSCTLGGHPATVLYFADIGLGAAAVTDPRSGRTHFIRFTKMGVAPAREGEGEAPSIPLPPGARAIN